MASKMGNLKQWQLQEVVTSTDHKNIQAEMSGDPIIGHDVTTGARSDFDIGDAGSGSVGHVVKDIFQRENNRVVILDNAGAIVKIINLSEFEGTMQGILSGKSKTSGFPDFLEAGGGANQWFKILGATTPLELTIDGPLYRLTSDLQKTGLGLAPAANNICLVNDINIAADPIWSKTIGEYGYWITIDTVGSEIIALDGTVQCFKINNGVDDEVFIATVDTTNSRLIPILRGIGGTDRIAFSNNDTITLLKPHYIFLDDNLATIDTTTSRPKWQDAIPSTPTTGDYWFKTSEKKWYRYSGTAWEGLGRMFLGYAICDSAGCKWVENEHYSLNWNELLAGDEIKCELTSDVFISGTMKVNVAGQHIFIRNLTLTSSNFVPGESLTLGLWHYVYITSQGKLYLSTTPPRKVDEKLGWYHPQEYWRCVSTVFSGNGVVFDETSHIFSAQIIQARKISVGIMPSGFNLFYASNLICPIVSSFSATCRMELSVTNSYEEIAVGSIKETTTDVPLAGNSISSLTAPYFTSHANIDILRNGIMRTSFSSTNVASVLLCVATLRIKF